jgi:hypothetical protein
VTAPSLANLGPDEKRALLKRLLAERASAGVGDYPLTHGQRALWFLQRLLPDMHAYNVALPLRFRPRLDLDALHRALDKLAMRHPALRTIFPDVDGQPVQRVLPASPVPLRVIDLAGASDDEMYHAIVAEHCRPFVLETRAFAATLVRRADQDALLLDMHHIIVDAWSLEILFEDLRALYDAELSGKPAELRPIPARFSDFVALESKMLAGPRGEALWAYWSQMLAGKLPMLDLGADAPPATSVALAGASIPFALSPELSDAIYELAKSHGTTLYTIVLVTTQLLVYRLSEETDVIIGTPVALRTASEFADVVGYFVNTIPVRATVDPEASFATMLGRARDQVIAALDHQDYPFSLLVDRLQVRRDTQRNPIFQVMLNVLVSTRSSALWRLFATSEKEVVSFGESAVVPYVLAQQEGQFELTVEVIERDGLLSGNLRYQTALYSEERALEIRDGFVALLAAVVAHPGARVAELDIPGREQFEL